MKTIKEIEKEFDKVFPINFLSYLPHGVSGLNEEQRKRELSIKSFYRTQFKKLLEGLRLERKIIDKGTLGRTDGYFEATEDFNSKIDKIIKDL